MSALLLSLVLMGCDGDPDDSADGTTDSGLSDDSGDPTTDCSEVTWWPDEDRDGFGAMDEAPVESCEQPEDGWVRNDRDCDDGDPGIWPGVVDASCDGIDQDCDGEADEDAPQFLLFEDGDGDGYGRDDQVVESCDPDLEGTSSQPGDCDDDESQVNPGAAEVCNDGLDNDCSGEAVVCRLSGKVVLDRGDALFEGWGSSAAMGASVSSLGDLDSDGHADFGVGGYGDPWMWWSSDPRGLLVAYGPFTSASHTGEMVELGLAETYQFVGSSAANVGDVDGDGQNDLLVGAPYGNWSSSDNGRALFHSGPLGPGESARTCCAALIGDNDYGFAGYRVVGPGDLTGDGAPDMVVSSPMAPDGSGTTYTGRVHVVEDTPYGDEYLSDFSMTLYGESGAQSYFGLSVDSAGDMDGDGDPELIVGAPLSYGNSYAGAAYLYESPVPGTLGVEDADITWEGPYAEGYLGQGVSGAGDVNGDGYDDVLLGAYGCRGAGSGCDYKGAVYLVLGPADPSAPFNTKAATIDGANSYDYFGYSLDGDFDADGDGQGDFVIASMYADPGGTSDAGSTHLFHGPVEGSLTSSDADFVVTGANTYANAGLSLAVLGDQDGDGLGDFAVGSPGHSVSGASYAGGVGIFNGSGL